MDPKLPIRGIDCTAIFACDMIAMRAFFGSILGFPLHKGLGGASTLKEPGVSMISGPTDQPWGHRTLYLS